MDEAIARLKLAADAGADVCFIEGVKTSELLEKTVAALAPKPVLVNVISGGLTPSFTCQEAEKYGAKIISTLLLSYFCGAKLTTNTTSLLARVLCRCRSRYPRCDEVAQEDRYRLDVGTGHGPQGILQGHGPGRSYHTRCACRWLCVRGCVSWRS